MRTKEDTVVEALTTARACLRESLHEDTRWKGDALDMVEAAIEVMEPGLLAKLREEECGICGSDLDVTEGKCDDCRGVPDVTD